MPAVPHVGRLRWVRAVVCLITLVAGPLLAAPTAAPAPRIAIIIDDLGYLRGAADRVAGLPGPVAFAILPHTPFARYAADKALAAGKEVLLHLPLQPIEEALPVGIGSIALDNTYSQLAAILAENLASVPHAVGINTHMGSLLTQHPGHMGWLMSELRLRGGLYFVDSYTTSASVALRMAREQGIPATRRDVFLDNSPDPQAIEQELRRLKHLARLHGAAVGIGHPYPETLSVLEMQLPQLVAEGFELVPVAALLSGRRVLAQGPAAP